MHRRGPVAIGALLSLSFFGGLQALLVVARNTVTTTVGLVSAPAEVRPYLTSPPITALASGPESPTESPSQPAGAVGFETSIPAVISFPAPAPAEQSSDPVNRSPKPIPAGPPPTVPAPVQPAPPVANPPQELLPIPIPVVPLPAIPVQGGAATKPPTTTIPLSASTRPVSSPPQGDLPVPTS